MFRKGTPNVHDRIHADDSCMDMIGTFVSRPCMYGTFKLLKSLRRKAVSLTIQSSSYEILNMLILSGEQILGSSTGFWME